MAELFDLYDEKMRPLGEMCERGDSVPRGKYHLVVNVLSVNFDSKVLITKRAADKTFGGMWEITGGAVISGETPLQAAVRELFEETGLKALPEALDYRGQHRPPALRDRCGKAGIPRGDRAHGQGGRVRVLLLSESQGHVPRHFRGENAVTVN